MFAYEEAEFEAREPVCYRCGTLLTIDEWEMYGDLCACCADEED